MEEYHIQCGQQNNMIKKQKKQTVLIKAWTSNDRNLQHPFICHKLKLSHDSLCLLVNHISHLRIKLSDNRHNYESVIKCFHIRRPSFVNTNKMCCLSIKHVLWILVFSWALQSSTTVIPTITITASGQVLNKTRLIRSCSSHGKHSQ